jgi:hypothetical protein
MDEPHITSKARDDDVPRRDTFDDEDYAPRHRFRGADYQRDREHLNLLSIFYFIFCGFQCLGVLVGLVYFVLGILMLSGATGSPPNGPPPEVGGMMMGLGGFFLLLYGALGTCLLLAGLNLRKRKRHTFCFVIACIICMLVPLGTLLGVFTILVLLRPSVKELFQYEDRPPAESERGNDNAR